MKTLRQVLIFALIGGIGFFVDTAVLYGLNPLLGPFIARAISFLAAATTTWLLNRTITFQENSSNLRRHNELIAYLGLMLIGGVVNYTCYTWLVISFAVVEKNLVLGVAVGSLAGMTINFLTSKKLLFDRNRV